VLLCKSGLEEHDRGVRYVARKLVEAGMEVIYIVFHSPAEAATVAVQEQVDVLGISSSAGGHLAVVRLIQSTLHELGESSLPLLVGGIIPDADRGPLEELGVVGVFGPGSRPADIVKAVRDAVVSSREP
jgi:methylmalonyl-CoA mutase C-terminal domain/subunit